MHLLYDLKLFVYLKKHLIIMRTLRYPELYSAYVNMVENALKTLNNYDKITYRKM